ncbi:MAG: hypothetical protein AB2A00_02140 [Myxococcota bacterium]
MKAAGWAGMALVMAAVACGPTTGSGGSSSGGDSDAGTAAPDAGPPTFNNIQATIFTPECADCHDGSANPAGQLSLVAGAAYQALLGPDGQGANAIKSDFPQVKPGVPEESFLYIKVVDRPPSGGGSRMPIGTRLSDERIALIRAWIAGGALPGDQLPAPRDGGVADGG